MWLVPCATQAYTAWKAIFSLESPAAVVNVDDASRCSHIVPCPDIGIVAADLDLGIS